MLPQNEKNLGEPKIMHRRTFITTGLAATALPRRFSIAQSARARTLRFVPQANLTLLDPIFTTALVTVNHGWAIYDLLFSVNKQYDIKPQMAEGYSLSDDGRTYLIRLREGLQFHNGEPVRAQDAAPSLSRWAARETIGQTLWKFVDVCEAQDDRTIRIVLKQKMPLLMPAIATGGVSMPFIVPEHVAKSDPFKQNTETIGSGPLKFVKDEFVLGARVVYEKNKDYVPRQEPAEWTSGGKVVHFDRIEWKVVPDAATAAAALENAEVDWYEQVHPDLVARLRKNPNIEVGAANPTGFNAVLRFNHLHPPFNNPGVRRAILGAITQSDYMIALNGPDKTLWHDNVGYFCPDTPLASNAGMDKLMGKRDYAKVKKDLEAAGYKGEKVALMVAVNISYLKIMGEVTADVFKKIGLNVDYQAVDWSTVSQRRAKMEPPDQGGWSAFAIYDNGSSQVNPASHSWLRGNGKSASFGWPESPKIEELRSAWFAANDLDEQKKICTAIQLQAFEDVPYIPLGQSIPFTGFRKNITGVLEGQPVFWNIKKA